MKIDRFVLLAALLALLVAFVNVAAQRDDAPETRMWISILQRQSDDYKICTSMLPRDVRERM